MFHLFSLQCSFCLAVTVGLRFPMVYFISCHFVIFRFSGYFHDCKNLHYGRFNKACVFLIKRKVRCYFKLPVSMNVLLFVVTVTTGRVLFI